VASVFEISFTEEPAFNWEGHGALHRWGFTILGRDAERFAAPLYFWDESAYERQWRDGVERLVGGADTSCLVTVMHDPMDDQTAQWWELYRLGDTVAVHERLSVPDFGPLDPEAIYDEVGPYRPENDEGHTVSEWRLPLGDFADYAARR
jgi:CdiI N-terminal domain